jgi:hypothetical protein
MRLESFFNLLDIISLLFIVLFSLMSYFLSLLSQILRADACWMDVIINKGSCKFFWSYRSSLLEASNHRCLFWLSIPVRDQNKSNPGYVVFILLPYVTFRWTMTRCFSCYKIVNIIKSLRGKLVKQKNCSIRRVIYMLSYSGLDA